MIPNCPNLIRQMATQLFRWWNWMTPKKVRARGRWRRYYRNCRPDWTELPDDVTASILLRLGALEILRSAQLVCSKWRRICRDPLMWRTIEMRGILYREWKLFTEKLRHQFAGDEDVLKYIFTTPSPSPTVPLLPEVDYNDYRLEKMCRHAVDRSCGNLVDITIEKFATDKLLKYITSSSSRIKRLCLVRCHKITDKGLIKLASKIPLLEDLDLTLCLFLSHKSLRVFGRSCPLLKSFKFNTCSIDDEHHGRHKNDKYALAIARTMPCLHHLQIIGNPLTNDGLRNILDCCPHLESLDLRRCFYVDLGGDLGKRCARGIKQLCVPNYSTADYEFDSFSDEDSDSDC